MTDKPTIVLVHGAFADASGFGAIIHELQAQGYPVHAPANPLRSLSGDAAAIHAHVAAIEGPVVLVGHSYGGAVIGQASATLDNVVSLVFLAAFGLDEGESVQSVQEPFPPSLLATNIRPTPFDAPGAPGGPDLRIGADFHETFCGDLSADQAAIMEASQRYFSAYAAGEKATAAGWKSTPSWYLVSEGDRAIHPDAERFMADRMGATTESIDGSHVAFIAQPEKVAAFILKAVPA